ncbi:ABC transporter ATP-binding protein [Paenibacillus sp. HB172176]|uniref:ABC transporter ATP-binding protein n=1 Tax=Paenibacillus sp. HB172176 TaxID=2493690 RepID=UPI001F10EE1F|nr:ABC transporter ATP-binding protein [Paenibacillus sp. HB172176]
MNRSAELTQAPFSSIANDMAAEGANNLFVQSELKGSDLSTSASPLLTIKGLTKSFGSFQALRGIDLTMKPGEIISVLGPSGCGKSTLLQLIAGLTQPDGGTIHIGSELIASRKSMLPPEKRGVNMVFQDYALWPHMNVRSNIEYGLKRAKLRREEIEERISELLELLHLQGLEKRLPPQLSGGQQQRVSIARALASRPRLMLLDEPLSNLDMRLRIEMRTEMAYLFRKLGTSVFHVTHDPDEAFAMADRIFIMRSGEADQLGTPQEVFSRPASRWSASLLGAINVLKGRFVSRGYGVSGDGSGREQGTIAIGQSLVSGLTPPHETSGGWADSTPAILMFRPQQVSVLEGEDALHAGNALRVKIVQCVFEGISWRARAETECGQLLYIVHENPLSAGDTVTISFSSDAAYLYRDEEER